MDINFPNPFCLKGLCFNFKGIAIVIKAGLGLSPDSVRNRQRFFFFFGKLDRLDKSRIWAFRKVAVVIEMKIPGEMLHNVLKDWNGRDAVLAQSRGALQDAESGFIHAGEGDEVTFGRKHNLVKQSRRQQLPDRP